jgi:hypothetical protein
MTVRAGAVVSRRRGLPPEPCLVQSDCDMALLSVPAATRGTRCHLPAPPRWVPGGSGAPAPSAGRQ